jgi:hypothetical protein
MGDRKKIERAILDGVTNGLSGQKLLEHVSEAAPHASPKKISKTAFHLLTDTSLTDRAILDTVYALALEHRLGPSEDEEEA